MFLWLTMAFTAAEAVPNRVVTSMEAGTSITDVITSTDGSQVAALDGGSGTVWVLDLERWDLNEANPCSGVGGIAPDPITDVGFFAGCADGTLVWFEMVDGATNTEDEPIRLSDTDIIGLTSNDTIVFGLTEGTLGGNPQVHAYNADTEQVLVNGFPSTLGYSSVEDMEANANFVLFSHGGSNFSKMAAGSGGATIQQGAPSAAQTQDITLVGLSRVFVAGGRSGVVEFQTGSNLLSLMLGDGAGISSATAVLANEVDEWFAVAVDDSRSIRIHELDVASGAPQADLIAKFRTPDRGIDIKEFAASEGYLFAGATDGWFHIMTDRPWIEASEPMPAAAVNETEVSVSFTSDTDGDWTARLSASDNEDGAIIASGSIEAGESATAVFVVDDTYKEGSNSIRFVVTSDDDLSGHDTVSISVDNPPTRVTLRDADVGFGNNSLSIEISGIDDEDLSHYMLYLSSEPFAAEDFAEEGPAFVGVTGDVGAGRLDLPRRINATPGADKTVTVQPLTNGATYYVAVRAYDAAGQEGTMSNVVSQTPRETFGAADLAGESGGMECSSLGIKSAALLASFGALFAMVRRAPWVLAVMVFVVGNARAETDSEWPQKGETFSDFVGKTFEARYGALDPSDPNIEAVFGDTGHNVLWLEYGATLFDLVELTAGLGYYRKVGNRIDASGAQSSEEDIMLALPVTADATFRLDVLPEQPIVPFISTGYDYWLWRETWKANGKVSGSKTGTHTAYGLHILLDIFQPGRASRLDAQTGVSDSYITVEFRSQVVGEDQGGLTFSGDSMTIGLKLDH